MIIKVTNVPFFRAVLRTMNNVECTTFKSINNKLVITSVLINFYYVELDSSLLEFTDYQPTEFSVNTKLLKKALKFFNKELMIRVDETLKLYYESPKKNYDIHIPLITTTTNEINELEDVGMVFVAKPSELHFFQNFRMTTYECTDKLIIKQDIEGGMEEMVFDVDIIKTDSLPFKCDNSWIYAIKSLRPFIESAVYMFNHSILQVVFNFSQYKTTKLIIQIPKFFETN